MKTISKVMTISLLLAMGTATGYAQMQRMTPEERAKMQTEALTKQLSLTQIQVPKVDSINQHYAKLNQETFTKVKGDREAMRKTLTEQQTQREAAMKAVLTDAQFEKYEEWLKEEQQRMSERAGGGRR